MEFFRSLLAKVFIVALIASVGIFGYIRYNDIVEHNVVREQKIESLEKELGIRRKVDEILQENREDNPNRNGSIALDRLRSQYPDSN